jgi:hypothetical protein
MQTSVSISALAKALAAFQGEAPNPPKTRTAKVPTKSGGEYRYTYADLADIITAMRPLLAKHGLSVAQSATNTEHGVGVTTLLTHASGEWIMSDPLILPLSGATAQAAGSAVTYARRYALSAILGISSEDDDDGELATKEQAGKPAAPHAPTQPPPKQPAAVPVVPYGKNKGMPITEAPTGDLTYILQRCDTDHPQWGERNRALAAAIEAELDRREADQARDNMGEYVAPPSDDDAPALFPRDEA